MSITTYITVWFAFALLGDIEWGAVVAGWRNHTPEWRAVRIVNLPIP